MDQEGYQSLRLVTVSYRHAAQHSGVPSLHAPSSTCPTCRIPSQFKRERWWRWPGTASPILTEFAKYLMSSVRQTWKRNYAKGTLGNQHAAHNFGHLQLYIHWLDSRPLIHIVGALAPIRRVFRRGISLWPKLLFPVLEHLVGITFELRGQENVPDGPVIYAVKHQSTWETMFFFGRTQKPLIS